MIAALISLGLCLFFFAVMTVRIQQAKARAAIWRKVAIGAAALAVVVFIRSRKGAGCAA